ncbi:MAG: DUF2116 family Zn-ribbon domain-containing protein [Candidatus Lokiarchaeota archaeon]|nr:DUF2116 family Zn-ribbon domain-containing protein [Candidatus Lokiarchaeota archaeon]MBD3201025.1 DUF2116 family Zn-ribbon domain-containing protein [Candidatus Lokiarchaeota archaeon]
MSSWKDQIQKQWGPHKHCPICGKAMPRDNKFCSQGCKDNYLQSQKKKKKKSRIQIVFLVGMMVVMFVMLFILG